MAWAIFRVCWNPWTISRSNQIALGQLSREEKHTRNVGGSFMTTVFLFPKNPATS